MVQISTKFQQNSVTGGGGKTTGFSWAVSGLRGSAIIILARVNQGQAASGLCSAIIILARVNLG